MVEKADGKDTLESPGPAGPSAALLTLPPAVFTTDHGQLTTGHLSMPITRTFLDWSQPALPAAAEHLLAGRWDDGVADLSQMIIVLPGRRACRRLLELLDERTESRLNPPEIITEGQFPELLYEPQRPFAGRLVQQLAWGEAVRRLARPLAERVLRDIPEDDDVDGWMAVGELLWKLHRELAAEQLDFRDVLTLGERVKGFVERRRWEALHAAQQEYLAILDGLHLWDRQTARLVALEREECRTDRDVFLIGTVDLNQTTRAMLDRVADRVTALIHAPPSMADCFDEHGCLKPDAWKDREIEVAENQLHVSDGPAEQADEVVRVLASLEGRYRADDITIGLADESLVPHVRRRLHQFDGPARWVLGKPVPQTETFRLLAVVADYLNEGRTDHFAALVRHPDVGDWLRRQGINTDWLSELDEYLARHLQQKLGFWLGSVEESRSIQQAYEQVTALLGELTDKPRPLAEWSEAILHLPLAILGDRDLDPESLNDRAEIDAFESLQTALAEHAEIPESLPVVVSGAQAIRLTLETLATESVPSPRDDAAVELLGWLELPLDDAPVLVVTSFNERYVPSSVDADLFLPNRLRQELGILDNDRRFARDAYALSAMLASRERVVLIAGRRDGRGDPLLPSRLALTCDEETIARRIEAFFAAQKKRPPLPAFGSEAAAAEPEASRGLVVPRPRPLPEPKTTFPVTALRDYLACPYRFYLKHILKLRPFEDELDEMSPRHFGTLLHDVLSDFGTSEMKDATDPREIADLLADRLTDRADREFGRWRGSAVDVQLQQMRTRLEAFAEWQAERAAAGWTIEFVELPSSEQTAELPVDRERSLILHGRIDRIDRHADGRWAIFDYKTGDAGKTPNQMHRNKGEWVDLQLPLYRDLAAVLGVVGEIELGYLNLSGDSKSEIEQIAEWSSEDLESATATAIDVARKILDQEFLPVADLTGSLYDDFAAICQQGVFDRRPP